MLVIENLDSGQYSIVSDSKSCLDSIASPPTPNTHPIIFDIKKILLQLKNLVYTVVFLWIPSHNNITGNDQVDTIAKDTEISLCNPPVYPFDLVAWSNKEACKSWQTIWDNSSFGRRLFSLVPKVGTPSWFHNISLDREAIVSICRIRFGHVRTNDHLFKINILDNIRCECSLASDSIDHTLFDCVFGDGDLRRSFVREMRFAFSLTNLNSLKILKTKNPNVYKLFASYLKRGKFYM